MINTILNSPKTKSLFAFCTILTSTAYATQLYAPKVAYAQNMDTFSEEEEDALDPPMEEMEVDPNQVHHGIGLRLRYVFIPKSMIELFMEEAPSGVGQPGFGLEYVRRKKNFEFSVGLEYDKLSGTDGFYVERGGSPTKPGTTDFIEFDGLSWLTIDASFVYHRPITDRIALRYGGGIGFGIVMGDIIESDATCTGRDTQNDCRKNSVGGQVNEKQDFFRYPPVFNVLGGVQISPMKNLKINIEMGLRTVFYVGTGVQYFF